MEEVLDIELDYAPRSVFQDFHNRQERWAVIVAHRRCGKTVAVLNDTIYRALTEGKENALLRDHKESTLEKNQRLRLERRAAIANKLKDLDKEVK